MFVERWIAFFQHNLVRELIEYEKTCGRRLKIPMAALCSYRIERIKLLREGYFYELIRSHEHVLSPGFAGTVIFESLYPEVVIDT